MKSKNRNGWNVVDDRRQQSSRYVTKKDSPSSYTRKNTGGSDVKNSIFHIVKRFVEASKTLTFEECEKYVTSNFQSELGEAWADMISCLISQAKKTNNYVAIIKQ